MADEQPKINLELFDKEVHRLLNQSIETIKVRFGDMLAIGGDQPDLALVEKYTTVYNRMMPDEHIQHYELLFNAHRRLFLSVLDDDSFLKRGKLYVSVIQLNHGSDVRLKKLERDARIPISNIYKIACDVKDAHIAAFKKYHADDSDVVDPSRDGLRPQIILLHLFRIFYHIITTEDRTAIGKIVTTLEETLGLPNRTVIQPAITTTAASNIATNGGLSSLFSMATGLMEKMGMNPPDIKPPSESEITNIISQVFNSEHTQSAIQGMFSSLQNCDNFETAVSTVIQKVTDKDTMEAIQATVVNATSQISHDPNTASSTTSSSTTQSIGYAPAYAE